MEIILTSENFDNEVLKSDMPVLVDFWAPWCGPCKVLGPIVEELSNKYSGKIKVGKLNVDENNDIAMRYNVMSIPTLKIFKAGNVAGEVVGAAPKPTLTAFIDANI